MAGIKPDKEKPVVEEGVEGQLAADPADVQQAVKETEAKAELAAGLVGSEGGGESEEGKLMTSERMLEIVEELRSLSVDVDSRAERLKDLFPEYDDEIDDIKKNYTNTRVDPTISLLRNIMLDQGGTEEFAKILKLELDKKVKSTDETIEDGKEIYAQAVSEMAKELRQRGFHVEYKHPTRPFFTKKLADGSSVELDMVFPGMKNLLDNTKSYKQFAKNGTVEHADIDIGAVIKRPDNSFQHGVEEVIKFGELLRSPEIFDTFEAKLMESLSEAKDDNNETSGLYNLLELQGASISDVNEYVEARAKEVNKTVEELSDEEYKGILEDKEAFHKWAPVHWVEQYKEQIKERAREGAKNETLRYTSGDISRHPAQEALVSSTDGIKEAREALNLEMDRRAQLLSDQIDATDEDHVEVRNKIVAELNASNSLTQTAIDRILEDIATEQGNKTRSIVTEIKTQNEAYRKEAEAIIQSQKEELKVLAEATQHRLKAGIARERVLVADRLGKRMQKITKEYPGAVRKNKDGIVSIDLKKIPEEGMEMIFEQVEKEVRRVIEASQADGTSDEALRDKNLDVLFQGEDGRALAEEFIYFARDRANTDTTAGNTEKATKDLEVVTAVWKHEMGSNKDARALLNIEDALLPLYQKLGIPLETSVGSMLKTLDTPQTYIILADNIKMVVQLMKQAHERVQFEDSDGADVVSQCEKILEKIAEKVQKGEDITDTDNMSPALRRIGMRTNYKNLYEIFSKNFGDRKNAFTVMYDTSNREKVVLDEGKDVISHMLDEDVALSEAAFKQLVLGVELGYRDMERTKITFIRKRIQESILSPASATGTGTVADLQAQLAGAQERLTRYTPYLEKLNKMESGLE